MEEMVNKFYKNKRILVTGATGFKGSWLCLWLNEIGAKVYGMVIHQIRIKIYFIN